MGDILLFLFIVFIVIPLIRALWAGYKLRRKMKNAFRDFQEQMHQQAQHQESRSGGWQNHTPQDKKKFDRSQGEYVEWEDVKITETTTPPPINDSRSSANIEKESQISDAEWEEIR